MLEGMSYTDMAGQLVSLIALGFCLVGFASKRDDRLMGLLISANVAFALQFALFGSWTAAVLSLLVIGRIILARRYLGNWLVMLAVLAVNLVVVTSFITIYRLTRMKRRYPEAFENLKEPGS
ncbi:YgjV family protein [Marinobacter changyiensis]|uniref:YgjV family protein n=1 Tax=Marinobacter changyiensis TaxID=2604091 RepID=UPI00126477DA|nr:YgjV family protein [Marinobacter changyiensis]